MSVRLAGGWLAVGLALLAGWGCSRLAGKSATDGPTAADDLAEVAGLLRDYSAEFRRGPARLADLAKHQPLYPRGYEAVRAGRVVVLWGVPLTEGLGDRVIAFEKEVESTGGHVLLENGAIRTMTAADFQAAPKAK